MKIILNNDQKIFTIQEDFNTLFPFLKLEIFSKPFQAGSTLGRKLLSNDSRSISDFRNIKNNNHLTISPDMSVADLEKSFRDIYGLGIQVFRKSGKVWLETTLTDSWTLEEQNKQGEALSKSNNHD